MRKRHESFRHGKRHAVTTPVKTQRRLYYYACPSKIIKHRPPDLENYLYICTRENPCKHSLFMRPAASAKQFDGSRKGPHRLVDTATGAGLQARHAHNGRQHTHEPIYKVLLQDGETQLHANGDTVNVCHFTRPQGIRRRIIQHDIHKRQHRENGGAPP